MLRASKISICVVLGLLASPALAAKTPRIGEAVKVVNEVRAEFERDVRDLGRGDAVHQDETVEVGSNSVGEIVLDDKTKLALGPGSRLLLDKFVYNGERGRGDIVFDLVKGTFRFVTGVAAKNSYRIRTPTAALTVRGTIFDVYIDDNSGMWILLMEGAIRACNDQGTCRMLDRPGQILRVSPRGELSQPARWAQLPGRQALDFDTAFPFVATPPGVDPNPTLTKEAILASAVPTRTTPKAPTPPSTRQPPSDPPTYNSPRPSRPPALRETYVPKRKIDPAQIEAAIALGIGIARTVRRDREENRADDYPSHTRRWPRMIDMPMPPMRYPGGGKYRSPG
jgi:hypothetical protein